MATNDLTDPEIDGPVGYIALCLAHMRAGYPITELDIPHVIYVAPTQTEVDQARHMAEQLAHRGEDNAGPDVRVFRRADGWVMGQPTPEACTSNHFRQQDGRPQCTNTAVWKVVEDHGMHLSIGFYCDADLPAEHRHLAQSASA